jgi:hypothetical protein
MEFSCDVCNEPMSRKEIIVVWNEDKPGKQVTELQIVHRGKSRFGKGCDNNSLPCSAGSCSYENWAFDTLLSFFGKTFLKREDQDRLWDLIRWAKETEADCEPESII